MARRRKDRDELSLIDEIKAGRQPAVEGHAAPLISVGGSVIDPFSEELLRDEIYQRELAMLRMAALAYTRPGMDIREVLPAPTTHEVLVTWQQAGEERLADEKGRDDLVERRRHYILRTNDLLPIDQPLIGSLPFDPNDPREYRMYVLRDEKEYLPIAFLRIKHPATDLRPILPIFRHTHARAILDWRAQTLDSWLSACPQFFGGYIVHEFSDEVRCVLNARAAARGRTISRPRLHTHEVKFDSWRFWLWYVAQMN
jgi:hypothetical protein